MCSHYLVHTFLASRIIDKINISKLYFIREETKILLGEVLKYEVHFFWSSEDNTQHLKTEGRAGAPANALHGKGNALKHRI